MQIEQVLRDYNGWLYKTANELTKDSHKAEDLVQEGRIAMWKAFDSYDPDRGLLISWLLYKAKNRMLTCVVEDRWVGNTRPAGSQAVRNAVPMEDSLLSTVLGGTYYMPESSMVSAHAKDIMAAINKLKPDQRRYVYTKFWLDYTASDLTDEFGSYASATANWHTKEKGAKHQLGKSLEHLKELV